MAKNLSSLASIYDYPSAFKSRTTVETQTEIIPVASRGEKILMITIRLLNRYSANQTRLKNSTKSRGNQTKKIKPVETDSKAIQVSQIDHHVDRFFDETALVDQDETRCKSRNSIDETARLPTQQDLEENYINLISNRNDDVFDSNDEMLKFLYSKRREIIDDIQLIDSVLAQYH